MTPFWAPLRSPILKSTPFSAFCIVNVHLLNKSKVFNFFENLSQGAYVPRVYPDF